MCSHYMVLINPNLSEKNMAEIKLLTKNIKRKTNRVMKRELSIPGVLLLSRSR